MNTVDKQTYAEYEKDDFKYPHQKKFKAWVENGCKPVVPESYYKASDKVRQMNFPKEKGGMGMTTQQIGEKFGCSHNPIKDLINANYSQIGDRIVNKINETKNNHSK